MRPLLDIEQDTGHEPTRRSAAIVEQLFAPRQAVGSGDGIAAALMRSTGLVAYGDFWSDHISVARRVRHVASDRNPTAPYDPRFLDSRLQRAWLRVDFPGHAGSAGGT